MPGWVKVKLTLALTALITGLGSHRLGAMKSNHEPPLDDLAVSLAVCKPGGFRSAWHAPATLRALIDLIFRDES